MSISEVSVTVMMNETIAINPSRILALSKLRVKNPRR